MDWIAEQFVAAYERVELLFGAWNQVLNWVYLLSGLAIAVVILIFRRRRLARTPRRARSFLADLAPRRVLLHPSSRQDAGIVFLNAAVFFSATVALVMTPKIIALSLIALGARAGIEVAPYEESLTLQILFSIYMLLAWDFSATFAHYLKHRVPLIWEFHKVHHSAEAMTPLTALRRHPVDPFFGSFVVFTITGTAWGIWILLFGVPGDVLAFYGLPLGIGLWYLLGYNLRHSHLWVDYGPFWSRVFISPAQHQIHHSRNPKHYDCNFGHIFAFWDRLLGSLYVPAGREYIRFGLEPGEQEDFRRLGKLYWLPFVKAARRFGNRAGKSAA